jgi:hypothetical protein
VIAEIRPSADRRNQATLPKWRDHPHAQAAAALRDFILVGDAQSAGDREKLSYLDFLGTIITDEIARRSQKKPASAERRENFRQ